MASASAIVAFFAPVANTAAAQSIPVVTLPKTSATSVDDFGAIINVRELSGGRLLVDDGGRLQVKLMPADLGAGRPVLDTISTAGNYYGTFPLPLFSWLGDSTLIANIKSRTVSVLDGNGAIARSIAMPRAADFGLLRRGAADNVGRLIFPTAQPVERRPEKGIPPLLSDSVPLARADFVLRQTDTLAHLVRVMTRIDAVMPNARIFSFWKPDPLQAIDDWAVLSDGSLAIVRGHDYHVDWVRSNGVHESSPKIPFDWRQLSDADKEHLVDSVQAGWLRMAHNNTLVDAAESGPTPWPLEASTPSPQVDSAGAIYTTNPVGGRVRVTIPERPPIEHVFDYYAPVRTGGVLADMDNHLWILPTTSKQSQHGELVYDVVNSQGVLFERVRLPVGRYIVGFGRDGIVYLATGSLANGFHIERATLPRAADPY